ncbi:hypothetical protein [Actinoplanes aureus]|uniref:Uncharacterized protein n=1 Tax=Actinoplanes aureus TaxID=2792083 RepID=A0A931G7G7_9ACTN|nr:hypothetical protein [Actinoplanes aureus]MBG0568229.1 hypothetical protein [Actinoplanes aureus]
MLSLDTVHALVDHLMQLDTAQSSLMRGLGTIAVVHDYPLRHGTPDLRGMRLLQLPLLTDHRRHQTLPAALHAIADSLAPAIAAPDLAPAPTELALDPFDLAVLRQRVHRSDPGLRLLAWAVCYDDLLTDTDTDTDTDTLTRVRRVEALDVDGRVYQLSHTAREAHPVVLVDEQPNPVDLPAAYPGLARLAAACDHPPT